MTPSTPTSRNTTTISGYKRIVGTDGMDTMPCAEELRYIQQSDARDSPGGSAGNSGGSSPSQGARTSVTWSSRSGAARPDAPGETPSHTEWVERELLAAVAAVRLQALPPGVRRTACREPIATIHVAAAMTAATFGRVPTHSATSHSSVLPEKWKTTSGGHRRVDGTPHRKPSRSVTVIRFMSYNLLDYGLLDSPAEL
ncbi:hypothetical protein ACQP2U_00680 [Nocardia sp. CA-084685]|uniref:hypothetical protein n=1 Tax=Nocardia sp. CA-084685 TaxID=3239970 RepID=UPI003D98CAEF